MTINIIWVRVLLLLSILISFVFLLEVEIFQFAQAESNHPLSEIFLNYLQDDPNRKAKESVLDRAVIKFDLLAPGEGWLLRGNDLYWTNDNGKSWEDITPPRSENLTIEAVNFVNSTQGQMIVSELKDNRKSYEFVKTNDGGQNWVSIPFDYLSSSEEFPISDVYMEWIDNSKGGLLFKFRTGNNFSRGEMFLTVDGGLSWNKVPSPMGEPFTLINENIGFMAGGPNGDLLFKTTDAGQTWHENSSIISDLIGSSQVKISLPLFSDRGYGLMPLLHKTDGQQDRLVLLETHDWGKGWSISDAITLQDAADNQLQPFLKIISEDNFRLWLPNAKQLIGASKGANSLVRIYWNGHHLHQLSMASETFGWAEFVKNTCTTTHIDSMSSSMDCSYSLMLASTIDGGKSWEQLIFPGENNNFTTSTQYESVITNNAQSKASLIDLVTNTQIFIGQGFDKCEIPTLMQMQTWYASSPYKTVNLYIGGVARSCLNTALNADYVMQLYQQGWKFFPTWVGPQAPCSGYKNKMSSDPLIAYQEGIQNANEAVATLTNLGLANSDGTGSVVYYDIEIYYGDSLCYDAVNAFMNGWSQRLNELGNLSGVYGAGCGSHLTNFFSLPYPPDVIWPASWYHSAGDGYYDPDATVWDVSCISDLVYSNHQRIRQYEGGHSETWGEVSLTIDSNVLDGVVAVPGIPDSIPPVSSVLLSGTVGENGWYRSSVFATISAVDNLSGVSYSQYNLDGGGWVVYSAPIDITANGAHTLRYQSVDNMGNWESEKSISFLMDTIPPYNPSTVTTGCTAQNEIWQNACNDLNFNWYGAGDTTSGLALYEYYWGTNPQGTAGVVTPYAYYDPPPVADGIYYLRVRTKDQAGNWSSWATLFTLRYDGTAPTGSLRIEAGSDITYMAYVDLSTIASDNASGVSQMHTRDVGGSWSEWQAYQETNWWILPQLTGQTYGVEIQYQDAAGNLSQVYSDSIYLDIYPHHPSSQNYQLKKSTFGLSATNAESSNFQLRGTLSQISPTGYSESENYQVTSGFWSWTSDLIEYFINFLPLINK